MRKAALQLHIGAQSVLRPHEWGWGEEVGLPTLFYIGFGWK